MIKDTFISFFGCALFCRRCCGCCWRINSERIVYLRLLALLFVAIFENTFQIWFVFEYNFSLGYTWNVSSAKYQIFSLSVFSYSFGTFTGTIY